MYCTIIQFLHFQILKATQDYSVQLSFSKSAPAELAGFEVIPLMVLSLSPFNCPFELWCLLLRVHIRRKKVQLV